MYLINDIQGESIFELKNVRINNATRASISSPGDGEVTFDTTGGDRRLYIYDAVDVAWVKMLRADRDEGISGQYSYTRSTGTSPFLVTSTTRVDNLNADRVDSYHASESVVVSTLVARDSSGRCKGADPSASDDLVPLGYMQGYVAGVRDPKDACKYATTQSLPAFSRTSNTITFTANGAQTVDGLTPAVGERILVKDELFKVTGHSASLVAGGSLSSGTTYYYVITAYDARGETNKSTEVSATPSGGNLTIRLTWAASTGSPTGYRIYRTTVSGSYGATTLVAFTSSLTVDDTGFTPVSGTPPTANKDASSNFIFVVTTKGDGSTQEVWTRATDSDTDAEVTEGAQTWVTLGTINNGSGWLLRTSSVTLNTTDLYLVQNNGTASITPGNGIDKTGNTLSVKVNGGTTFIANAIMYANTTSTLAMSSNFTWDNSGLVLSVGGDVRPGSDSTRSLGSTSLRWNTVYASALSDGATAGNLLLSSSSTTVEIAKGSGWQTQLFYTGGTERWRITSTGILQSNGAQTIQTSGGTLSIQTGGGLTGIGGSLAVTGTSAIGGSVSSAIAVYVQNTGFSGADQSGIYCQPVFTSAATSSVRVIQGQVQTAAASFTVTNAYSFLTASPTVGSGSAITNIFGLRVNNQGVSGITNAYGIYIDAQSGAATTNIGLNNEGTTRLVGTVTLSAFSQHSALFIGASGVISQSTFYWNDSSKRLGLNTNTTPSYDLSFGGNSNRTIGLEETTGTDGATLTVRSGNAKAGTTDTASGNLDLTVGASCGANAGFIRFIVPLASASGTTTNTPTAVGCVDGFSGVGRFGFGVTSNPSARAHIRTLSIGATQSSAYGLYLDNTTAAGAGAQQYSPPIVWVGQGWKTDATAASQSVAFRAYVVPVQGTANPTGFWTLESSVNGASFTSNLSWTTVGGLSLSGSDCRITIDNASGSNPSLVTFYRLGSEKAQIGTCGAANYLLTGTSIGDLVIRPVSSQRIWMIINATDALMVDTDASIKLNQLTASSILSLDSNKKIVTSTPLLNGTPARVRHYTITGDGTTTAFDCNHDFASTDVGVSIWSLSGNKEERYGGITRPTTGKITVTFKVAPGVGVTYRVQLTA